MFSPGSEVTEMATELPLRIILVAPPVDVDYGVQHGKGNDYTTILIVDPTFRTAS